MEASFHGAVEKIKTSRAQVTWLDHYHSISLQTKLHICEIKLCVTRGSSEHLLFSTGNLTTLFVFM